MGRNQDLTVNEAIRIGTAIRKALSDAGVQANICVVNRGGTVLFQEALSTEVVARDKARQAALMGRSTRDIRNDVVSGKLELTYTSIPLHRILVWAGGYPIFKDGRIVGGAGINNESVEQCEMFCSRGIQAAGFASNR